MPRRPTPRDTSTPADYTLQRLNAVRLRRTNGNRTTLGLLLRSVSHHFLLSDQMTKRMIFFSPKIKNQQIWFEGEKCVGKPLPAERVAYFKDTVCVGHLCGAPRSELDVHVHSRGYALTVSDIGPVHEVLGRG